MKEVRDLVLIMINNSVHGAVHRNKVFEATHCDPDALRDILKRGLVVLLVLCVWCLSYGCFSSRAGVWGMVHSLLQLFVE